MMQSIFRYIEPLGVCYECDRQTDGQTDGQTFSEQITRLTTLRF